MEEQKLLEFLSLAEKLKCNTRHSWTSNGRQESVAEHTYRLMVFAWLVKDEFPDYDMNRVMQLCLFHDLGEAVTGDVPAFIKTEDDEKTEEDALMQITSMLPEERKAELAGLFREVLQKETKESKLVQALDKLEAVIQHNEAAIDTWLPLEYNLQFNYGQEQTKGIPYMKKLRERVFRETLEKISRESHFVEKTFGVPVEGVCYFDRLGAYLIAVKEGKVAVVRTSKGYFLPGGGIEEGETHIDCMKRECIEETGYAVLVERYEGSAEIYGIHEKIGYFHPIQYYYSGTFLEKVTDPIEAGHVLEWMPYDDACEKMYVEAQRWILKKCKFNKR